MSSSCPRLQILNSTDLKFALLADHFLNESQRRDDQIRSDGNR